MLVEFLSHLVSFDLFWVVDFALHNLHWVFALFAAVYIFYDGKRVLAPFLLTVFMLWASLDFTAVTGWVWAVPVFLSVYYISRIALIIFCSEIDRLKNILPVVFVIHFMTILTIFNLFMR